MHLSASWGGNADIEFSAQSKIINRVISRGKEWYQQSINRQHTATHSACATQEIVLQSQMYVWDTYRDAMGRVKTDKTTQL